MLNVVAPRPRGLPKLQVQTYVKAAEEDGSSQLFVVDETNLLAPSTEKYLERLLKKLQEDTGLKLRPELGVLKSAFLLSNLEPCGCV